MKNKLGAYGMAVLGLFLLGAGLCLVKTHVDVPLPYILVGLGCGIFGHGAGKVLSLRVAQKQPERQKQIEVEIQDERNVALVNRAKAKAYDQMVFMFGALLLVFALMAVPVAVVLLLVFAYLLVVGCKLYYQIKYHREM